MSIFDILSAHFAAHYTALILDNEVTVDQFVIEPPLPWIRLVHGIRHAPAVAADGQACYGIGPGYPTSLTAAQARFERRNWDAVSAALIMGSLHDLGDGIACVVIGNNAGQGLQLANSLPEEWRRARAVVIYGRSLPEQAAYEAMGYRAFCARRDLSAHLAPRAKAAGRPLALAFINTIQHNDVNFHEPF